MQLNKSLAFKKFMFCEDIPTTNLRSQAEIEAKYFTRVAQRKERINMNEGGTREQEPFVEKNMGNQG